MIRRSLSLTLALSFVLSAPVSGQSTNAQLESLFRIIDTNSDTFLSKAEYLNYYDVAVAPSINRRHANFGSAALEDMHRQNRKRFVDGPLGSGDSDGDGKLSLREYKAYNARLMNLGRKN